MSGPAGAMPRRGRGLLLPELRWPADAPALLQGARVDTLDWSVLVPGRGCLFNPAAHLRRTCRRTPGGILVDHRRPVLRIEEPAVLIGGYYNYYHNLIDYALACRWIETLAPDAGRRILVPQGPSAFQAQTLDLFGVPPDRRLPLPDGAFVHCRALHVLPRAVVGAGQVVDCAGIDWARSRAPRPGPQDRPRVYISRATAARRRLLNEDEILPILLRHGFDILQAEGMGVAEQARRFGAARTIMGLHGAGLSNMIFAAPGAEVIEFISEANPTFPTYFQHLARGCGHAHRTVPVHLAGRGAFRIDPAALEAALAPLGTGSD